MAVALSGGVDSAVAACLLRDAGVDCTCLFMRNWDEREEGAACSADADARRAQAVAARLGLPFCEVDFVSAYWTRVFSTFLEGIQEGRTPNPDLACNRHIKFDLLLEVARQHGCDYLATGHYARVDKRDAAEGPRDTAPPPPLAEGPRDAAPPPPPGEGSSAPPPSGLPRLLRGADRDKDQSYFLASVRPESLNHVIFPLGEARSKADVRAYARARGLVPEDLRSSAGICFVGRRKFGQFLSQYVEPLPGTFVGLQEANEAGLFDGATALGERARVPAQGEQAPAPAPAPAQGGQAPAPASAPAPVRAPASAPSALRSLAPCPDLLSVTVGQRAPVGGAATRLYVAGKDAARGLAYVVPGSTHPALRARAALLEPAA